MKLQTALKSNTQVMGNTIHRSMNLFTSTIGVIFNTNISSICGGYYVNIYTMRDIQRVS